MGTAALKLLVQAARLDVTYCRSKAVTMHSLWPSLLLKPSAQLWPLLLLLLAPKSPLQVSQVSHNNIGTFV